MPLNPLICPSQADAFAVAGDRPAHARIAPRPLAIVLVAHVGVLAAGLSMGQEPLRPTLPVQMISVVTTEQPAMPELPVLREPRPPQPAAPTQRHDRAMSPRPVLLAQDAAAQTESSPLEEVPLEPATPPTEPSSTLPGAAADSPAPASFDAAYLNNPRPSYPPLSRRAGEQGTVVLRVLVQASGEPSQVGVRTSSGFERLDKVAVASVKRWRFTPGRQGSTAMDTWVDVPITFSLEDAAP